MSLPALEVLRRVPLFAELAEADLEALAALARERRYPKGSVIVFSGELGDALYVIARGRVKVVLLDEDGREVILALLGAGSFFGELALLDEEPRSAHVIAVEHSMMLVLRRADFRARLRQAPELSLALLRELSRRLRRADERIGAFVLLDVPGRVAHLLLRLAADAGGGDRIPRRLTHDLMGQLAGTSRESFSRALRRLAQRDIIEVTREHIVLRDRHALELAARQAPVPRPQGQRDGATPSAG